MNVVTRISDKAGSLGSIVSAMGCGACFPALASLGAALGLGFLSQFEALFVTVLLPLFAGLALLANALGWFSHRQWHRTVLGMIGPVIVLIASFTVAEKLLYVGLAAMVGVSIWDFVSPANRRCGPAGCEIPAKHA
ncbi:organomercurial transporter MerC [Methylibium sp. T29-B]|jgi:mercuric ion transport protein|uniref:organomercurial transporter MerC n=1 Tax=Methylibium sp. T29-B TaxID=1437443 RepID=UPI0003F3E12B|nr:organomercurial transporter MerC [Methylibium sp. T29-B]MBP6543462.1 organomercurial transporter MerC [Piscinibacter sp.]MCW5611818.1 organomercurial transporter MerC [Rubrivivax sp.]ODU09283.1 MAG: mercury transport protein MerC [Rubrivivax sp. SCN 71-131]TXH57349.1 MAG: organomercurial transporter MerC [Burkholderiaceae bacterium]HQC94175.1 organomercurial transporter MerC [Aquabacterium sp.]